MQGQRFVIHPDDSRQDYRVAKNCRQAIRRHIEALHPRGKAVEIIIKPHRKHRTLAQNALFHAWMTEIAKHYAETHGDWHPPEVWKEYLKRLFLGEKAHTMPDGRVVTTTRGTSDLKVDEFAAFLDQIDMWAAQELELMLPHPEDMWAEAMGRSE